MTGLRRWPWRRIVLVGGPPTAWMAHLLVSYVLVPPSCSTSTVPLHVTTAASASVAVGAIAVGIGDLAGERSRRVAALVLGGLFVLAILLQGAANTVVDPCA